jgi:hypothetical protein
MNKTIRFALAVVPLLLSVACTDANKAPAEAAVKAGDAAAQTLTDEVAKLAPDQTKAVRDGLAAAKDAIAKQDYKRALADAKDLPAMASKAVADAQAKKDELAKVAAQKAAELKQAWEDAQTKLPVAIADLKKQVAAYAKAKKLPKGITKDAVAQATQAVAELEAGLAKATEQAKTDVAAAGAAAKELTAKAAELAASLTKQ